ncbi:MAG: ABC transporter ATP-binding protein [Rickettsiales bacterium]
MNIPPRSTVGFFLYFLGRHKLLVALLLITGIVYGVFTTGTTYMIKLMVDVISSDDTTPNNIVELIKYPAIAFLVLQWLEVVNFRITDITKLKLFPAVRKDIHSYSFKHLSKQSYSYFQNSFAGNISNRLSELINGFVSILQMADEVFASVAKLIISATMLIYVKVYFGIFLFVWAVCLILLSSLFTGSIIKLSKEFSASKSHLGGIIVDNITNIVNVLSFANNRYENQVSQRVLNKTVDKDQQMQWKIIHMRMWQDLTFMFMMAAMLGFCIYFYKRSMITAGDFVLVMSLSASVSQNMWWIANQYASLSENIGKCSQAISIINTPIDINNKPGAGDIKITKGKIEFRDLTFYYQKKRSLFENKNITIESGEKVGLVGFTGSGKSSFINLIMRFYDPVSGGIYIDDQNIADYKLESLRKQVAIIPQDTSLFHRTIMENIRYGNIQATDAQVKKAAKNAHCESFINELSERYDTFVGERGVKLSGGQRQRIAIARAFLKNAPIIILDEATSALDSITEKKIQKSLDKLTTGRTTIVIAHRLSTLSDMDRILVFDQGKIIQDGSHHKLIREKGHYKKLWEMQADGFLPQNTDQALGMEENLQ